MAVVATVLLSLLAVVVSTCWGATPAERAQALLDQMTLDQMLSMVHGISGSYAGTVNAIPELGIPVLHLEDGPQGVADGVTKVTCWPSALTVVASWDPDMYYQFAQGMAEEQWIKGTNVMLGPMNNLARVPVDGRNFESTGEDPFLGSAYVTQCVKGVQSKGVIACAKHYADNNQEENRGTVNVHVDERTQYELYYPQFQAAIDAGVGSIMCSYNKVNDTWACENDRLLNKDLKGTMGFQGFVMSDWGATHSTVESALAGLDMEMAGDTYFGAALTSAVESGLVPESCIEDKALRILTSMFAVGIFDTVQTGNLSVDATSEEHNLLARTLSENSIVLLKNDNQMLPLDADSITSIGVFGRAGRDVPIIAGSGSGEVKHEYVVTPYAGIKSRLPRGEVQYSDGTVIDNAIDLAKQVQVAVVVVGTSSGEGSDRRNLNLDYGEVDLVNAILAVQPNTIVVVHSPGSVLLPFATSVPAILECFMPGQEDGNALASVLFGDVNPSGKLPLTFPVSEDQTYLKTVEQYPGLYEEEQYSETIFVGYRWFDKASEVPQFPFGHGLSYTTFGYSSLSANNTAVSFTVTNTGSVTGAEVAQVYVGFPPSSNEPPKVLRGFSKVTLAPGKSIDITLPLNPPKDLSIWSTIAHDFVQVTGQFAVYVGSSSRDIRLKGVFNN
ncbi:glycoside hydrolase superfamily [Pelomyxa schiedti]|nr:glycoside hydrolase superfamily [Pelomyxa schiedti]